MPRGIILFTLLILTFLHIIYFPTTITAKSPFLNNSPISIPKFRGKGGTSSATSNPSSPTPNASLDHQRNIVAEATTKMTTMVHSTVYGGRPTNTGKPSVGSKSSGCKGVRIGGEKEILGMLTSAMVGIVIVFLAQLKY